MNDLDALRALFEPTTQTVQVAERPNVRKAICTKCPFGDNLSPAEQRQADAIKDRLSSRPGALWGCHETVNGGKPQICAGFAAWRSTIT